jgi:hypothetical protein
VGRSTRAATPLQLARQKEQDKGPRDKGGSQRNKLSLIPNDPDDPKDQGHGDREQYQGPCKDPKGAASPRTKNRHADRCCPGYRQERGCNLAIAHHTDPLAGLYGSVYLIQVSGVTHPPDDPYLIEIIQ